MLADWHGHEHVGWDTTTPFEIPSTPYESRLGLWGHFVNDTNETQNTRLGLCLIYNLSRFFNQFFETPEWTTTLSYQLVNQINSSCFSSWILK